MHIWEKEFIESILRKIEANGIDKRPKDKGVFYLSGWDEGRKEIVDIISAEVASQNEKLKSDLISRKALIKAMEKKYDIANTTGMYPTGLSEAFIIIEGIINEQPVAYDVDKVIDKLSNKMFSAELYGDEWDGQTVNNLLCMGDIYEIVKGGGIDE